MVVKIHFVDECKNKAFGTTEVLNENTILVQISRSKNKKMSEFFITMLHELLHVWMFILKANGITMSARREHKWIYLVQNSIVKAFERIQV